MKKEILHIYKRVSTEQQDRDGHSLEYQEDLGIKKSKDRHNVLESQQVPN